MKTGMKGIVLAVAALLMVSFSYAIEQRPQITVNFTEEVNPASININLTNQTGALLPLSLISSQSNTLFVYRPAIELSPGLYIASAQASDLAGNRGYLLQFAFSITIPQLLIDIIEPRFGVSQKREFNITATTDRASACKYSFLEQQFDAMAASFESTEGLTHRKTGFTNTGTLFVKCKDQFDSITSRSFNLAVDESPPDITYRYSDPVYEAPISTNLVVRTNEHTVCKYVFNISNASFESMRAFPDFNEMNESSYKPEHTKSLTSADLRDYQSNAYYIRCKNKAGLLSFMEQVNIFANTNSTPTIVFERPLAYSNDRIPEFNVSTNKQSVCRIANNSGMENSHSMEGTERKHYFKWPTNITAGRHTYTAQCVFAMEGAVSSQVSFVIDSTPPVMGDVRMVSPLKNRTDITNKDDELCAEWNATDRESGIQSYSYFIYWDKPTDVLLKEGTTAGDDICANLELNDSQKYFFKVNAKNYAGLVSVNATSQPIEVDTSSSVAICDNGKKDSGEAGVDCGGTCSRKCQRGSTCVDNSDCVTGFCNSTGICAKPSCTDKYRNGQETDVDCGGGCPGCEIGRMCRNNTDCKSRICEPDTLKCGEAPDICENGKKDGDETDVDCGGSCESCSAGKNCKKDSDCAGDAVCKSLKCTAVPRDSDNDGVIDEMDNCPDIKNTEQKNADNDTLGDLCDGDNDNDGMTDEWEQKYFGCDKCANPDEDSDGDLLTNIKEYQLYKDLNPTKSDTDGDGFDDKTEVDEGTNPVDANSFPSSTDILPILAAVGGILLVGAGSYVGYRLIRKKGGGAKVEKFAEEGGLEESVGESEGGVGRELKQPEKIQAKEETRQEQQAEEKPKIDTEKIKEDVFRRLKRISEAEEKNKVEEEIKSIRLSDEDIKKKIESLKRSLH